MVLIREKTNEYAHLNNMKNLTTIWYKSGQIEKLGDKKFNTKRGDKLSNHISFCLIADDHKPTCTAQPGEYIPQGAHTFDMNNVHLCTSKIDSGSVGLPLITVTSYEFSYANNPNAKEAIAKILVKQMVNIAQKPLFPTTKIGLLNGLLNAGTYVLSWALNVDNHTRLNQNELAAKVGVAPENVVITSVDDGFWKKRQGDDRQRNPQKNHRPNENVSTSRNPY